jgi:hypothetical protein
MRSPRNGNPVRRTTSKQDERRPPALFVGSTIRGQAGVVVNREGFPGSVTIRNQSTTLDFGCELLFIRNQARSYGQPPLRRADFFVVALTDSLLWNPGPAWAAACSSLLVCSPAPRLNALRPDLPFRSSQPALMAEGGARRLATRPSVTNLSILRGHCALRSKPVGYS